MALFILIIFIVVSAVIVIALRNRRIRNKQAELLTITIIHLYAEAVKRGVSHNSAVALALQSVDPTCLIGESNSNSPMHLYIAIGTFLEGRGLIPSSSTYSIHHLDFLNKRIKSLLEAEGVREPEQSADEAMRSLMDDLKKGI